MASSLRPVRPTLTLSYSVLACLSPSPQLSHRSSSQVPGAFFFLGGNEASLNGWARGGDAAGQRSNCMCHNTAFDFNDNVSPLAAVIFTRLVEERLGVNVYGEDELPVPMLKGLCAEDVGDDGTALSHAASNVANGPIKLPPAKKPRAK